MMYHLLQGHLYHTVTKLMGMIKVIDALKIKVIMLNLTKVLSLMVCRSFVKESAKLGRQLIVGNLRH